MSHLTPKRLSVALDPSTHPLRLSLLAYHPVPWLRRTAVGNPSTPLRVRRARLKDPYLAAGLFRTDETVPTGLLRKHAASRRFPGSVLHTIAMHPNSDDSVRWVLVAHENAHPALYVCIAERTTDVALLDAAEGKFRDRGQGVHSPELKPVVIERAVAGCPVCPTDRLTVFAETSHDVQVLDRVALHANAKEEDRVLAAMRALQLRASG